MTQLTYLNKSPIAFAGLLADLVTDSDIVTGVNEEAVPLAFGTAVKQGTAGDQKKLPTTGSKIVGVVLHQHGGIYNRDSGAADVPAVTGKTQSPGVFNVLQRGRVWAICRGGCAKGDPVFVQITTNGARKQGDFCGTDDGANAEACTNARWQSAAADGGFAILEVSFGVNPGQLS